MLIAQPSKKVNFIIKWNFLKFDYYICHFGACRPLLCHTARINGMPLLADADAQAHAMAVVSEKQQWQI